MRTASLHSKCSLIFPWKNRTYPLFCLPVCVSVSVLWVAFRIECHSMSRVNPFSLSPISGIESILITLVFVLVFLFRFFPLSFSFLHLLAYINLSLSPPFSFLFALSPGALSYVFLKRTKTTQKL